MAARHWLGVVICFAVVSENNCQRTCSLTAGRLPISVKYCTHPAGHQIPVNQHSSLASRTTCTVTCLEDAKLRFLVCDDGIWHMTPNLCKGQTDVQVLPKRRPKRWWWVPIAIIFISWGTRQGPPPDRSPPVVNCPIDIHKFSDPIQTSTKVYWNDDDASAYDSKDGAVAAKRASRKRSGYLFGEGRTSITYTARDRAGNMGSCVMTVTVTTIRCSPGPNMTFKNGYYVCHPSADFVYGTNCNYGCYYGYKIKGSKHRECKKNGHWLTTVEPACENSRRPTDTIMSVLFYYEGPCTEEAAQNQIKTNFLNAFKESPFSETLGQSGRTIANVKMTCGSSDNGITKRETRVTMKVDILLSLDGDVSRETFKDAEKTLLNLYNHITEDIKGDNSKLFQHLDQKVRSEMEIERPTIELDCPLDTFPSYNTYSCVGCGEGLYYSEGDNSCKECPIGTYQPEAEGRGCIQCPGGRTPLQNKTTTVDRCLPMCQLGHFSENGVEPCTPCSQGQYADHLGSTECSACSCVMTTVSQGSDSVTSCRQFDVAVSSSQNASVQLDVATKGFDIKSGFELRSWLVYHSAGDVISLTFGDKHTSILSISMTTTSEMQLRVKGTVLDVAVLNLSRWYQININYINSTLSISVDEVQRLTHDVSFDANDGQSILVSMGGAGFEGSVSQVNMWRSPQTVPSPTSHTCFTGSLGDVFNWKDFTSANLSDSFIQIPSECDDTDECLSSPCIHGDCNDDLNRYTCSCEDGYHGDNCDVNMDDCLENECTNGGTCVDGVAEYTCRCTPEYTGQYCDAILVHGHWTAWGNWTEFSTPCGPGERTRARRCDNPQPQNGGDDCEGSETEVGACDTGECPECSNVSPPEHGDLECTDVDSTRLCQLKCEDGYDFDRSPLSVYKCGLETGYEWSYVTEDNPQGRFPNCIGLFWSQFGRDIFSV